MRSGTPLAAKKTYLSKYRKEDILENVREKLL